MRVGNQWNTKPVRMPYDFVRLMSDVVTLEQQTGLDAYARPTFGAKISVRCRIDSDVREIRGKDGLTRTSSTKIIFDRVYGLEPEDRIVMPNGDRPTILSIKLYSDDKGPLYEEVYS